MGMNDMMGIVLGDELLSKLPTFVLRNSQSSLKDVPQPTGAGGEDMPAIREFLAVCQELDNVVKSYAGLVRLDADRIDEIIEKFKISDQ